MPPSSSAASGHYPIYFGQPSGGFFLRRDSLMAFCQSLLIFSVEGAGPRLAFEFSGRLVCCFFIRSFQNCIPCP
jgi:hypothetical protein